MDRPTLGFGPSGNWVDAKDAFGCALGTVSDSIGHLENNDPDYEDLKQLESELRKLRGLMSTEKGMTAERWSEFTDEHKEIIKLLLEGLPIRLGHKRFCCRDPPICCVIPLDPPCHKTTDLGVYVAAIRCLAHMLNMNIDRAACAVQESKKAG